MAKAAYVKRLWSKLYPADEISEEAIRQIPPGEVVRITWARERNPKFHNKMFGLLRAGFANQECFSSFEMFREWALIKAGWADVAIAPDGKAVVRAKSISFSSVDEDKFAEIYSAVLDVLFKEFGTTQEIVDEFLRFA